MCYSPYYGQAVYKNICMIEEMATKNDVPLFNSGDSERAQRQEYFQDASSLNNNEATGYSKEVAKLLNYN